MSYKCGDLIMKCKPFVHTLNVSQKSIRCDFCFKQKESLKKCGNCKQMYYCDKNCQKLDWSECHKNECKILKNFGEKLNTDFLRIMLRLWLSCKYTERKSEIFDTYNEVKRSFDDLMTHSKEIREDIGRKIIFDLLCITFKLCGVDFDYEQLFDLFCKYTINAFGIKDNEQFDIGHAIYIGGSVFNHSCAPNACVISDGIDMEVRALKPISFGEEVFIEYTDVTIDRNKRRTKLREQYYFECNCIKCFTHSDSGIDYNLIASLRIEFLKLGVEEEWDKQYSIGLKIIPLYHQIYGDFHPNITVQLYRMAITRSIIFDLDGISVDLELIEKLKKSIEITHGFQHSIYEMCLNNNWYFD